MASELVRIGSLLADPTRAEILVALMDGRARTGSELARHVGVAASTASEHLGKLLDASMVRVEPQGRDRYWRLAGPSVAELLEALGANAAAVMPASPRAPAGLARVRTWAHATMGCAALATTRLARCGDNMRDVAVTEGDKVEAQAKLGFSVNG